MDKTTLELPSAFDRRKSVLQQPCSVSNGLQSWLDGWSVIALTWGLVEYYIGSMTAEYLVMLLLLVGILAMVYDLHGIYRCDSCTSGKTLKLFKAWTISFAILLAIGFITKQTDYFSRALIGTLYVGGFVIQLALHTGVEAIRRRHRAQERRMENALVIGDGRLAGLLYDKISVSPWLGQRIVGAVTLPSPAKRAAPVTEGAGLRVLGPIEQVGDLIARHNVKVVYIVTSLDTSSVLEEIYFSLLDKHVAVHWIPDIFSLRLVNYGVKEIAGIPVLTLSETPLIGTRKIAKAVEDFVLASLILILISPLLMLIALAIKFDSPGPVFFRQNRTGWNGKTFRIWKFRSMYVHQPDSGVVKQAQKNDPRVTRVGAFIRRTSLDELPQLFNVLTGEMSLVGPRPHAVQHDAEYSRRISAYFARHKIKPGITGLAQVRGFRGETPDIGQMAQRVEADIEYINNWSVWLDLSILVRTVTAFTGKNAY